MPTYGGVIAEEVRYPGHNGDLIDSYVARPLTSDPVPGVVVIHHMPGWDEWTTEVCRKLAHSGYAAVAPSLFCRFGPGSPDDLAAGARNAGGVSDAQVIGDVQAAIGYLKAMPNHNGKIGAIGFCSGGRHTYLVACSLPSIDAAVDCWGGGVVVKGPEDLTPNRPVQVLDMTKDLHCPLLGIFGNDDANPSPDHVNRTEAELKKLGKNYEFHRYDGAGHGFFAHYRPGYRADQATDGWQKVLAFYDKHLKAGVAAPVAALAGAR